MVEDHVGRGASTDNQDHTYSVNCPEAYVDLSHAYERVSERGYRGR